MSETIMPRTSDYGIFTGLLDVYVAKITKADSAAAAPTYDTPRVLGLGIEVNITPSYTEGKLHASNRVARRAKRLDSYTVKVNVDAISAENRQYVLGRVPDENGVEILTGNFSAPEVAIGFAATKDNGEKEFWWLYRCTFSENENGHKTAADGIEYRTPTLEAVADRRIFDNALAAVADSTTVAESVLKSWFDAVYEPAAMADAQN